MSAEPDVLTKDAYEYLDKHPSLTAEQLVAVSPWPIAIARGALAAAFSAATCVAIAHFLIDSLSGGRHGSKPLAAALFVGGFVGGMLSSIVPTSRHPLQAARGMSATIGAAFITGIVFALARSRGDLMTAILGAGAIGTAAGVVMTVISDAAAQTRAKQLHADWKARKKS